MGLSIACLFLCGLTLAEIFDKLRLPRRLGMILAGILIGPGVLGWLHPSLLGISPDLRQIALIIILTRAGLSLKAADLKKVGRPAALLCFVPACFEIGGFLLLGPPLLHISLLDAAIVGATLAAVSPAVIVPRMLKLMDSGYGANKSIPQMILAGASVDDVFVIVVFGSVTSLAQTGNFSALSFLNIPVSIISGLGVGLLCGVVLLILFRFVRLPDTIRMILMLCAGLLLAALETFLKPWVAMSAMLGVMAMGFLVFQRAPAIAKPLSQKFSTLWVFGEIVLFVLVGANVDLHYAISAGFAPVLLILAALVFRSVGVLLSLIATPLTLKERLFCVIAYLPKATVQAAIGGVPLAMGLPCGQLVLTVAVLGILITAPIGAIGIDLTYRKFLSPANAENAVGK